jgi:hypothetical protein
MFCLNRRYPKTTSVKYCKNSKLWIPNTASTFKIFNSCWSSEELTAAIKKLV